MDSISLIEGDHARAVLWTLVAGLSGHEAVMRCSRAMRYPSRRAYLELAGDPQIANTIGKHCEAGLESQWLFAMTEVTE